MLEELPSTSGSQRGAAGPPGDIGLSQLEKGHRWPLVGGGQDAAQHPEMHRKAPLQRTMPKGVSAEAGRP